MRRDMARTQALHVLLSVIAWPILQPCFGFDRKLNDVMLSKWKADVASINKSIGPLRVRTEKVNKPGVPEAPLTEFVGIISHTCRIDFIAHDMKIAMTPVAWCVSCLSLMTILAFVDLSDTSLTVRSPILHL